MVSEHIHISYNVSKLGVDIPSVNLPVVGTCSPDAPCFKKRYTRRGRFCFQRNKAHLQNNLKMWLVNPRQYEYEVGIVAKEKPNTRFLAFTKKYELINAWLDTNNKFPANLTIVLSAWGDFRPDNLHN